MCSVSTGLAGPPPSGQKASTSSEIATGRPARSCEQREQPALARASEVDVSAVDNLQARTPARRAGCRCQPSRLHLLAADEHTSIRKTGLEGCLIDDDERAQHRPSAHRR